MISGFVRDSTNSESLSFVNVYGGDMSPDYEEMTFFFLGEGDTGKSQGIEGGLGVFASFRSSSVRRYIKL